MRRRWIQINGKLEEVSVDYIPPDTPTAVLGILGDKNYHGLRDTKGEDISTRTKHREYMKRNNFALTGDFTEQWKKDAAYRASGKDSTRISDVIRSYDQHIKGK